MQDQRPQKLSKCFEAGELVPLQTPPPIETASPQSNPMNLAEDVLEMSFAPKHSSVVATPKPFVKALVNLLRAALAVVSGPCLRCFDCTAHFD